MKCEVDILAVSPSFVCPSTGEDGSPRQIVDVCAPHGYYELEIKIAGDNTDHLNSQEIQWEIDAVSNEVNDSMTLLIYRRSLRRLRKKVFLRQ